MKLLFYITLFCFSLQSCAPKAIVSLSSVQAPIKDYEGFVVFEEGEPIASSAEEIGYIKIGDAVLTVNCNYETVLDLATTEARKMGANSLKIIEHKFPNAMGSSCHRIKAIAYHIEDITPYETEIEWHAERKLKIVDFKGSIEDRPFLAVTSSKIEYSYQGRPIDGHVVVTVKSTFNCRESYFKHRPDDKETLAHEQGHFDITEIYARKLIQAIAAETKNVKELQSKGEAIYNRITSDWRLRQDQYDSDTYDNPYEQIIWFEKIKQDLYALNAFAKKEINISF